MVSPQEGMAEATIIIMYTVASSPLRNWEPVNSLAAGLINRVSKRKRQRAAPVEKSAASAEPRRKSTP